MWSIATNLQKYFFFVSILPLAVHSRSDTPPVVTATVVVVGVGVYMGCINNST
jgi:hypothetical protein